MLNTAAQVSVGSRDLVLENGPDTMSSSDEDSKTEEHGEVLTGMCTEGLKAPVLISQAEVARQKAAWFYAQSQRYGGGISSDSELSRAQSVLSSPAPSMGGSKIESSGPSDSSESESPPATQKRKRSGKKGSGKKAATRPADHPMVTRSQEGCRAGGIRGVGGSGQTDTCVSNGSHSKT
jgi:hypothetical protein